MISILFCVVVVVLFIHLILKFGTKNYDRFKEQGLKFVKPFPIIGNSQYIFTGKIFKKITETYKMFPNEKVVGMFEFTTPVYFLRSPDIIKHLTVKEFQHFQDHGMQIESSTDDLFGNVLFFMKGKQWRDMRTSLSPLFTGSKMRLMLQLMGNCNKNMEEFLKKEHKEKGTQSYGIKKLLSKITNDVIASCAFGVECNSFSHPNNEIYAIGQKMLQIQKPTQMLKFMVMGCLPKLSKWLGLQMLDDETRSKFRSIIINTMDERKKQNIVRPDMMHLLMRTKDGQLTNSEEQEHTEFDEQNKMINGEIKKTWTDMELIAQCLIFFIAGFDGTSTVLSFLAYELAVNPDVQEKLIEEIDATNENLAGRPLTYEALQKMKYMHMVISEVLRRWSPAPFQDRKCIKDYTYEDDDGLKFTIKEGEILWLPLFALQMDPEYFPNPEKFDPDRFSDENKAYNNMDAYLPFGIGPRHCIGFRFALMELKAVMYHLLLNFKLVANEETQIPMKLKDNIFGVMPEKEIKLNVEPRTDNTH